MKNKSIWIVCIIALSQMPAALFAGVDAEPTSPATDDAAQMRADKTQMPKLNIRWTCGDCVPNPKVASLIESTYSEEIKNYKKSMVLNDVADVDITSFRQRNPGVRVMFGSWAGGDRLNVKITYNNKEFIVGDDSHSAVKGMNAICEAVAYSVYQRILEAKQ